MERKLQRYCPSGTSIHRISGASSHCCQHDCPGDFPCFAVTSFHACLMNPARILPRRQPSRSFSRSTPTSKRRSMMKLLTTSGAPTWSRIVRRLPHRTTCRTSVYFRRIGVQWRGCRELEGVSCAWDEYVYTSGFGPTKLNYLFLLLRTCCTMDFSLVITQCLPIHASSLTSAPQADIPFWWFLQASKSRQHEILKGVLNVSKNRAELVWRIPFKCPKYACASWILWQMPQK